MIFYFNFYHPALAVRILVHIFGSRVEILIFHDNRSADRHEHVRHCLDSLNGSEYLTVTQLLTYGFNLDKDNIAELMLCKIGYAYCSFVAVDKDPLMVFRVLKISGNIHLFIFY